MSGGLHAPTVPSGPISARVTNGDVKNLTFTDLQRRKENLEAELKALSSVLDSVSGDAHGYQVVAVTNLVCAAWR